MRMESMKNSRVLIKALVFAGIFFSCIFLAAVPADGAMTIVPGDGKITISIDGELFTEYIYTADDYPTL